MLSIQNSSPLIPQLEISGLKSSDETLVPSSSSTSFDNNKVVSIPDEHVLTKGPTINKFSIRDYVFKSRSKDIKNSWPFSEKSLQICLKNDVKHLLPPFQSFDSMKNHYNSRFDEEDEVVIVNNDSHQQEETPIFPIPCSSSVIINKPENTLQPPPPPPVKKCRVVNRLDPNSKELVDTMNFADHAMVSKICPVCKIFSSSSNTTLNAHIDQCLSTESSNDKLATSDPRPPPPPTTSKNKIKPRKMRLMVDIYVTARHCTLEELDRRNGTSWATRPMPIREEAIDKSHHKEEKLSVSKAVVQKDNNSDDGEVYIDANGTKLRILSKSDDKPVEGSTTNKILPGSKKRLHHRHHHMQKLQKPLKLADPQSKKASFPKSSNNLEIPRDPEMNFTSRKSCNVSEKTEKSFKAQQHKKDRDFTPIKKWACAKRTNFFNRTARKEDSPQKLGLECHSSDGPVMENSFSNKRIRNSFESITPFSSPESSERMEKTCDKVKQPLNRISSFHGGLKGGDTHEIDNAGDGQPNELALDLHRSSSEKSKKFSSLRSEDNNSAKRKILVKKRRRVASNSGEELEGIHIPSPQTIGSLSGNFHKEGNPQTSLSNSLVNPLCLLEDNMSDDHDHDLYNANHEMGNPLILDLEEVDHDHDRVITGNESSNYFHGVDPIPIPGPPGSFLPSPSPMDHMGGTDELHGNNSSLTNSSLPESCENQYLDNHDHVDNVRDSSDSPTSLASTISSRENFSKVNPPDATNNIIHSEKLADQLCCCAARKDQDVIWKQMTSEDPNRNRLDHGIHGPDHESLKNLKLDPDLIIKFPINGECSTSSVSPSSPNPVLRLMGKNLMVVNKDDNSSMQQQQQYRPQWTSDSINPIQQQLAVNTNNHMAYQQAAPVFNLSSEYNRVENHQPFDHVRSYNNSGFDNSISHLVGSYNFVNDPPFRRPTPSAAAASAYHHDPMKEIIVIDDTPETTKTDSDSDVLMGGSGTRQNWVRPMVPANNTNMSSREKILPFYRYHHHQTQNSGLPYGGILPSTPTNGSFQMPMTRLNRNSEGSSNSNMQTAQINPNLVAATTLPSASHPGGMLYYSRGFS
ncbi:uncharacterized protein LOC124918934 [Impatiens glandulifera]|uniref:uncharacterized protein LOC124918934 n=1 Tax=Impatiens glandulifera TaxID=253017 RepID=UPI001FB10B56|nr:uncharacterized protein LOC124918934 [Impatiens glandulifera]